MTRTATGATHRTVTVGVVGCGRIARMFHLPVLAGLANVRVVAVADPDPAAREAAARLAPGARAVEDVAALLDEDVEAVVVCTPTHLHAPVAVAVLRAGRDVYVEKPLAPDLAAAAEIRDAWRDSGRLGIVGFNFRHHPRYRQARAAVASGRLGVPVAARAVFASPPRELPAWKRDVTTGGGALLDLATHHLDLVPHLLGDPVAAVSATTTSTHAEEDTAAVQLTLCSGLSVQSLASLSAAQTDRVELIGDLTTLEVDRMGRRRLTERSTTTPTTVPERARAAARVIRDGASATMDGLRPPGEPSFATALAAFVAGVAGQPVVGIADVGDGHRVAEVVDAARRSSAEGRRVAVGDAGPG
jgi:predicted dehydrogenase